MRSSTSLGWVGCLLAVGTMVLLTGSQAWAQDAQAEALVNRMIEAAGGMAAWDRIQDVSFKLTLILYNAQGEPAGASASVYWLKRPNRGRTETLDENGHLVLGFDGEKAWALRDGKSVTDPATLKRAQFLPLNWWYWLGIPFKLKDPGVVLAHKGMATLPGRQVELLEVTFRPGTGTTSSDRYLYYVNSQTARVEFVEFWLQGGVWPGVGGGPGWVLERLPEGGGYHDAHPAGELPGPRAAGEGLGAAVQRLQGQPGDPRQHGQGALAVWAPETARSHGHAG